MEKILCVLMIPGLLFLFWCFGKTASELFRLKIRGGMTLLFGTTVYYGLFQMLALPLILTKSPLSALTLGWAAILAVVGVCWLFITVRGLRKRKKTEAALLTGEEKGAELRNGGAARKQGFGALPTVVFLLMLLAVALQFYYVVTNPYLGWDTSSYVGTIGTSVTRNSMYQYDGESGSPSRVLNLRYALSGFFMHAALWCQVLPIRAIHYAKIVQAGVLVILANVTIFELGRFLFSGKRYEGKLDVRGVYACGAGMVIAAVFLNFFYKTIYTTSDFLLNRALEGKGYCANFLLPLLFLLCLWMWREEKREGRIMLFAAMFSSVAISMSALVTAPALVTVMMTPVLIRRRSLKSLGFYLLCMLPNVIYLALYLLYTTKHIRIRI